MNGISVDAIKRLTHYMMEPTAGTCDVELEGGRRATVTAHPAPGVRSTAELRQSSGETQTFTLFEPSDTPPAGYPEGIPHVPGFAVITMAEEHIQLAAWECGEHVEPVLDAVLHQLRREDWQDLTASRTLPLPVTYATLRRSSHQGSVMAAFGTVTLILQR